MSRCGSFPPPGYVWNGVEGEELIELILKRTKEGEKDKKERKKEKRRQKKEMQKSGIKQQKKKRHHKRVENARSITDCESSAPQQKRLYQTRGSGNCNSIQVLGQPMISDSCHDSSSGEMDCRLNKELDPTSERNENVEKAENALTSSNLPEPGSLESDLRDLILNWIPSPMQCMSTECDDQDWLFGTRLSRKQATDSPNGCNAADSCSGSLTQFPYAHWKAEPIAFVLPYVVPF